MEKIVSKWNTQQEATEANKNNFISSLSLMFLILILQVTETPTII
jgi:hypothetical protein